MDPMSDSARSYLDFAGLGALRARAQSHEASATLEAARQFEGMFIQMMLQSMRAATVRSDLIESSTMDTYEAMFDRELSVALAGRGGFGLAEQIAGQVTQWQGQSAEAVFASRAAMQLQPLTTPRALVPATSITYPLEEAPARTLNAYGERSFALPATPRSSDSGAFE